MRGPGTRTIEKAKDVRGTLRRLVNYLKPHTLALAFIAFLVVAQTLLDLLGPWLMGKAMDDYIESKQMGSFIRIALAMAGAYLGSWLVQVVQTRLMAVIGQRVLLVIRRELFEHLQSLSLAFFDRHPHGELMSRLTNDIDVLNRAISFNVVQLLSSVLTLGGILAAMFALNWKLALGSLLVFPLMVWVTLAVAKRTRAGFRQLQGHLGELNSFMEESITGQRVVQAFGQQGRALAEFDRTNGKVRDVGIRAQSFAFLVPPMMSVLSNAGVAVVAGLGGWLAVRGLATVGDIVTFITYSRRFANPLRHLADVYNSLQSGLAGAERVFQVIDEQPDLQDAPGAQPLQAIVGEVEFDHVDFGYVPDVPVLKDITLHAKPGQTIALVGPTGAGKTTMVNVLSRFYDLQGGAIRIDGQDIRTVTRDSLRRQLGVVLQDAFLFADTVMENIRYGRLGATDEEVIAAAKLANADWFIHRLPEGYQTRLSERGSNLSQGQRQLLTIARAILADPRILILDEATSSVDTRTEIQIQQALLKLMEGRTSFVIAHRLSTIRGADQLLVIRDGQIIERGTHRELLAQGGFYHDLYMSQFRGTKLAVEAAAE
ncbi:MAG: ABC transporter ATP-binding protein [Chloroflexi bacterium]|nr:ABC transporter ATP-binding protein [Chloroflexota bacterium]